MGLACGCMMHSVCCMQTALGPSTAGGLYCQLENTVRLETIVSEDLRAVVISLLPPPLLDLVDTEASALAKGLRDDPRDLL